MKIITSCTIVLFLMLLTSSCQDQQVKLIYDENDPQTKFAAEELTQALDQMQYRLSPVGSIQIAMVLDPECCGVEGYKITHEDNQVIVRGADASGLMYGGLDLAEYIRHGHNLMGHPGKEEKPYIAKRGIKFNIPLDIRTSSFDDSGDAAQENIEVMWDLVFWKDFFDDMARFRYNAISFWNAHPFSSMVHLDDYPDVAFQDVLGTTIRPQDDPRAWTTPELASRKAVDNPKVLKKMTIEEKIKFWQDVMGYAKDRGIEVYFITWNICLNGAAPPGSNKEVGDMPGKYGITNNYQNPISKDYLRKSVEKFILTYPDLAGIGVTAGENMRAPMTDEDKEKWLWETYGLGILDAKKQQPERVVKFIHRFWWTDMEKIMKYWGDYPDPFEMSFKYAKARLYSSTQTPFHKPLLDWMKPQGLKSWWNLRNDDIFIHRWGNPEYVSAFIKNLPIDQTAGFHMGSDGYVWGKEFISKVPELSGEWEIDKHWYRFMLWGRLGYNPDISRQHWEAVLSSKFPDTDSRLLYDSWAAASSIIPQVNRYHWRDWDYMWAPEACMEVWNDVRDVNAFRTTEPIEAGGYLSPQTYVKLTLTGKRPTDVGPIQVAANLEGFASEALKGSSKAEMEGYVSSNLEHTWLDIQSMAHLGQYYASKIRGATALEFFKQTGELSHKEEAIEHLQNAKTSWNQYAAINKPRYKPQNLARLRTFDWDRQLMGIDKDIRLAEQAMTYHEDLKLIDQ